MAAMAERPRHDLTGLLKAWRGGDTALSVTLFFAAVLYVAGFWMFANREEDYPN